LFFRGKWGKVVFGVFVFLCGFFFFLVFFFFFFSARQFISTKI